MPASRKIASLLVAASLAVPAQAADVVIGVQNWTSIQITGEILRTILEENLGLEAELQTSTNPVIFEGMERGSMHVHPEVWLPNQQNLHDKYVGERDVVDFNPHAVLADQYICATKDTVDKHGIASIYDLTDPGNAALFDSDSDGKGEIWIGGSGWASTNVEKIRAKSYGYAETMELVEMDEALAVAALDAAVKAGKPHVMYCYTPHTMFSRYDLVPLEEPPHDASKWNVSQPTDDPNWLENSEAGVAWSPTKLHIHWAKSLAQSQPEAVALLSNAKFEAGMLTDLMYEVEVEGRSVQDVAGEWVGNNSSVVESWLGQ
jgi:glycine betaine/proline transport system substrate-binding protein